MKDGLCGRKFFVRTFGCQMNENDSEHIAGILTEAGAVRGDDPGASDIIIVNTCAVREKSEEKLYSYLGRLASLKKRGAVIIGVTGCVAQVHKDKLFAKRPFLDFVVGPGHYADLPDILENAGGGRSVRTQWLSGWRELGHAQTLREGEASAFVTVMEGCDNFCAYCIVPYSRGREKCRPFASVLKEVRDLAAAGYKEVQLLGQNVNAYRDAESGLGFAALLDAVCAVPGIGWVRFLTSHPKSFGREIIGAMARNPKICRHLHLPLQSGATTVLARMNRGYDREGYLGLVGNLRDALPGIFLGTDIIVGFPGETEDDFEATCSLLAEVRFASIFSFRYSPRPLTSASRLKDDVPQAVKRLRLVRLQALQKQIQLEINRTFIGQTLPVLALGESAKGDGLLSGRTEGNQVVNFSSSSDVLGSFVDVRITDAGPYSLRGESV